MFSLLLYDTDLNIYNTFKKCSTVVPEIFKKKYEEYKISLISHIYFSVIIDKENSNAENLKLNLEIIDELDNLKSNYSYDINQIDFIIIIIYIGSFRYGICIKFPLNKIFILDIWIRCIGISEILSH